MVQIKTYIQTDEREKKHIFPRRPAKNTNFVEDCRKEKNFVRGQQEKKMEFFQKDAEKELILKKDR